MCCVCVMCVCVCPDSQFYYNFSKSADFIVFGVVTKIIIAKTCFGPIHVHMPELMFFSRFFGPENVPFGF